MSTHWLLLWTVLLKDWLHPRTPSGPHPVFLLVPIPPGPINGPTHLSVVDWLSVVQNGSSDEIVVMSNKKSKRKKKRLLLLLLLPLKMHHLIIQLYKALPIPLPIRTIL